MELSILIAKWSGKLPPGFVPQAVLRDELPRYAQPRCTKPASRKPDGRYWKSCDSCRTRRAASRRRRRAALAAEGGCRRWAYRKRAERDFLCERCRRGPRNRVLLCGEATQQCLKHRRVVDIETLRSETAAWATDINNAQRGIVWHMRTNEARRKLKSIHPQINL